jgi:hypothetical protein
MNQDEVVKLMESSKSEKEWRENADKVKAACGGHYPGFWFNAILASGLMGRVTKQWGGSDKITVQTG